MGISRNTVKKYAGMQEPVRRAAPVREAPVMAKVGPKIDELLEQWDTRTTKKQRVTATWLHAALVAAGVEVGITRYGGDSSLASRTYWKQRKNLVSKPIIAAQPGQRVRFTKPDGTISVGTIERIDDSTFPGTVTIQEDGTVERVDVPIQIGWPRDLS